MADDPLNTLTGFSTLFCAFSTVVCVIFGIFYLIFAQFAAVHFLTTGAILVTTVFIYYAFRIIGLCLVQYHVKNEVDVFQRIQNRLLVGLGMVTVCTLPIRMAVLYIEKPNEILVYSMFITSISISLNGLFFFRPIQNKCRINSFPNTKTVWRIVAANIIASIAVLRYVFEYIGGYENLTNEEWPKKWNIDAMRLVPQLCMPFLSAISTYEFYMIWNGEFRLYDSACAIVTMESGINREHNVQTMGIPSDENPEQLQVHATAPMCNRINCPFAAETTTKRINVKIDCKICLHEYSQTRIPRILEKCGHTVCEECATKLLDKNRRAVIFCPFCQTGTAVNGPASLLSRNYSLLDVLDDLKKNI